MLNGTQSGPAAAIWPPAPQRFGEGVTLTAPRAFELSGVYYKESDEVAVVDNDRLRRTAILFWVVPQIAVLSATIWVQYQSMLWFQNVWEFRGRTVLFEVLLQAVVWVGMAAAYAYLDWTQYNHHCRFGASFNRLENSYEEGGIFAGSLDRIAMVEVVSRRSLFTHQYEVRLLLNRMDAGRITDILQTNNRALQQRVLAGFRTEADAQQLADAVASYLGTARP